jgi:hypothetical protein
MDPESTPQQSMTVQTPKKRVAPLAIAGLVIIVLIVIAVYWLSATGHGYQNHTTTLTNTTSVTRTAQTNHNQTNPVTTATQQQSMVGSAITKPQAESIFGIAFQNNTAAATTTSQDGGYNVTPSLDVLGVTYFGSQTLKPEGFNFSGGASVFIQGNATEDVYAQEEVVQSNESSSIYAHDLTTYKNEENVNTTLSNGTENGMVYTLLAIKYSDGSYNYYLSGWKGDVYVYFVDYGHEGFGYAGWSPRKINATQLVNLVSKDL